MHDTELYRHLLGLEAPWSVARVEVAVKDQKINVWAQHAPDARWACPKCKTELALYDHAEERSWRHLDSCQFQTFLLARIPRVECPTHGVLQVAVSWAEARSRFTVLFERFAIDVLRETSVTGATKLLRVSWDEAWGLMRRAVERGQARKGRRVIARIGVDEKSVAKGQRYMTLVNDLERATVEYIGDERTQDSLNGYFQALTPRQLEGIEAVAMDMWEPFILSVKANVPKAESKIVFDKFHIVQHMTNAVDLVRRSENRALREVGDESLVGSKYLWLYGHENLPEKHRERFDGLHALNLKTGRAWALKESLRTLWDNRNQSWARNHWGSWNSWATRSKLKPVIAVARMVRSHLENVMTYFRHRITNAVAEGLNSKIQGIKKRAFGYRNKEHYKIAIFFHCGGLNLYPATHAKA
jgi:transposase